MARVRSRNSTDVITDILQKYADRGVFRGFQTATRSGGRREYRFIWLIDQPFTLTFDPRSNRLACVKLFAKIGRTTPLASDLQAAVRERTTPAVPPHKRVDARRARLEPAIRNGAFSIALTIRGANHEDAVRKLLNLVNELFLLLRERYPDYLSAQFGMSTE
jgi:hypothetical protein